ncbi:hypothetical protein PRZ48_010220 [Zasmidium cellare]|uniref:Uncharacterized protein n=1 Tax=Zasmidium cellare TaxID=395010 RepID=A0ABR0EDZ7_ZASCE|nr:hypothetical protein PRZ48_010220 [Zasmidium cellare]
MDRQQQEVLQLRKQMGRLIADFWMSSDDEKRDQLLEQKREIQRQIKAIPGGSADARVEAPKQQEADLIMSKTSNLPPTKTKQKQNGEDNIQNTQKQLENVEIAAETLNSQKRKPTKRIGGLAREAAYLEAKAKESQEVEIGQRKRVKQGTYVVQDPEAIVVRKRTGPSGSNLSQKKG